MSFNGDLYPTAGADVVMTTKGDMVDYNTARQRLAIGSTNQILQVKSGLPSWETLSTAGSVLTTQGDILYEDASGLARLGFGTSGDVLTTKGTGANPVWETPSGGVTATSVTDENYSGVYSGSSSTLGANALIYGQGLSWSFGSYKFLRCSALECKIGSTAAGNFQLTLWGRNNTWGKSALLAWTHSVAQSRFGTDTIAKLETVGSAIIPATKPTNTDMIICVHCDDATSTFYFKGGTGVGAPLTFDDSAQYYVTTDVAMANSYNQPELKFYGEAYS